MISIDVFTSTSLGRTLHRQSESLKVEKRREAKK